MGKRIVINLDTPAGGSVPRGRGKPRRWLRVLGLLAGLVFVILAIAAAGAFFWWRHYQSTPAYTLTLIIDAAQRNDVAEVQKRIDADKVTENLVAEVSEKATARYGMSLTSTIKEQINVMMPTLLPRFKQTISDEIVKEIKQFSATSEPQPFIYLLVTVPSLMKVTTEGDVAKATASINERPIELTMRRDADRWKVTGFKDDVVVQRVVDNVIKELPAIGSLDPGSLFPKKTSRGKRPRKNR